MQYNTGICLWCLVSGIFRYVAVSCNFYNISITICYMWKCRPLPFLFEIAPGEELFNKAVQVNKEIPAAHFPNLQF